MVTRRGAQGIGYETLVRSDRVHSRVYTDPAIFGDEIERIFHRGWVFVGHASEVPEPGDFRLKRIGLMPVILVRDLSGNIRLLLNRCRHRGATVCQHERGNARFFRCSYHGWTYQLDGRLTGVPYPGGYDGELARGQMGLTPVTRIGDYRGFIFGNLSPVGATLEHHLGRVAECVDRFIERTPEGEPIAAAGTQKYRYGANWKLQAENSLDGYHPPFVHQSVLASTSGKSNDKSNVPGESTAGPMARTSDLGGGHVTLTQAVPVSQAGNINFLVFPNLAVVGIQLRVISPLSVDRTLVDIIPTLLKGASDEANANRLREHEGFFGPAAMGSPDDTEVFERVQTGYAAGLDPWIFMGRGRHRERSQARGVIVGDLTDEVPQRGIWRHWLRIMASRPDRKARSRQPPDHNG